MRAFIFLAAIALGLGSVACGARGDVAEDDDLVESAAALRSASRPAALVDRYEDPTAGIRKLVGLELRADGTYAASVNISDVALCRTFPCTGPETGVWTVAPLAGACSTYLLRLVAAETGEARVYRAQVVAETGALQLTDATGSGQTLSVAAPAAAVGP